MSTETFEAYIHQNFIGLPIFSVKSALIKLRTVVIHGRNPSFRDHIRERIS